jgi:pimeloyl-ACP methyl ester carboxylesterase
MPSPFPRARLPIVIAWDEAGSGPPIVFVHGLTEDRRGWTAVIEALRDRHRCIRLELPGHGESSDADDYGALAMASAVATVVDEAGIAEPPVVVGHSLGAVVVTAYAAEAPVRGVVNIDQGLRFGDFATAIQPLGPVLRGPDFQAGLDMAFAGLGIPASLNADARAYLDERHAAGRREVVLGVWGLVLDTPPDELDALAASLLGSITVPYLAVHGSDPGPGYAEWLRSLLSTATVEVWDGDGHYPHLAEPQRLAARIDAL